LVSLYSTFKLGSGSILASGDNRAIVSAGYLASQLAGNGLALTLLIFGVMALFAYTIPALSRSFLNDRPESKRIIDAIFAWPFGTILTLSFVLYSLGFVLFGVPIWRSETLPRWAGILVTVHAPLISGPFSVVGSLLAVAGGGWIALSVLRSPPAQQSESRRGAARRVVTNDRVAPDRR
jgi:hypothetical protein